MKLVLDTWRGTDINDGTNYIADFPENAPLVNPSTPILVDMLDVPSLTVGRRMTGSTVTIFIQPQTAYRTKREELRELFKTEERFTYYTLTAHDEDNSDQDWFIEAAPLTVTPKDDSFIVVLATKTPYWKSTQAAETHGFTASGQTIDYTVSAGPNHSMFPKITLLPQAQKAGGYLYERWLMMRNQNNATGRGPFDFGDSLDTAALVTAGKMLSSGFDVRLLINNVEVPRWFGNFNSADTKIWATVQMPNTYSLLLKTTISNIGTPTDIEFKPTALNIERFKSWPDEGTIVIDSEGFTYTSKDETAMKVSGITRSYRNTTAATHTVPVYAHLQTIDVKLVYGNNVADDPEYPDDEKPTIDLDNSTNLNHITTYFGNSGGARDPQWAFTKSKGNSPESREYTFDHGDDVDPYEVAGMQASSYDVAGVWRADTVSMRWAFVPLYRVNAFTIAGERYSTLVTSPNGRVYTELAGKKTMRYLIPANSLLTTWQSWTHTSSGLAASQIDTLYVSFIGSVGGIEDAVSRLEIQTFSITYNTNYVPTVVYGPENGTYDYDLVLRNVTTGHIITVKRKVRMAPGTIVIDVEEHQVLVNGKKSSTGVTPRNTKEWFKLDPGVNQIRVTEAGLASMDVTIEGPATRGV